MTQFLVSTFNYDGHEYQTGINSIERAARAGITALQDQINNNALLLEDPQNIGFHEEVDENGIIIHSEASEFERNLSLYADAQSDLRKAFVLAAYHFWERSVIRWSLRRPLEKDHAADKKLNGYKKLVAEAKKIGPPYDPHPSLDAIVQITNLLKHESKKAQEILENDYPDLWASMRGSKSMLYTSYARVNITQDIMNKVFEVVRLSGPLAFKQKLQPKKTAIF
ncbi:MAG: hypothetical protein ABF641_10090 [Acetobacter sp.]